MNFATEALTVRYFALSRGSDLLDMFVRIWRRLKKWRRLPLGPVSLLYRFDRSVHITKGSRLHRPQSTPKTTPLSRVEHSDIEPQELAASAARHPVAVLVGVGPGFGFALARRLAQEGFDLVLVSRKAGNLAPLVQEVNALGVSAEACGIDATDEVGVDQLFSHVERYHGNPSLVVYSVQYFSPGTTTSVEVAAFEAAWRHNCLGAFLVARKAARLMQEKQHGTILLVGSTSSVIGRAEHLNLAVGKFGQRALAQVLARELWPLGIHVAHVIIDADIQEEASPAGTHTQSDPNDIAHSLLHLHRQPRSAWTSELDLRPWKEQFWEHC